MLDDSSFVQVIALNPDDDGPRLLYADYLDEKGTVESAARAEFIRVQCALAAISGEPDNQAPLQSRERALLSEYWAAWVKPACQALAEPTPIAISRGPDSHGGASDRYSLRWIEFPSRLVHVIEQAWEGGRDIPYFHSAQFRRGLLAHVALAYKTFRTPHHVARLFEKAPLDGLSLMSFPPRAFQQTMAGIDGSRLRSLELIFAEIESVAILAADSSLSDLHELILQSIHGIGDPCYLIGHSATLQNLRCLMLSHCNLDSSGVEMLCRSPIAGRIETLEFHQCHMNADTANALIREYPPVNSLKRLVLSMDMLPGRTQRALGLRFGEILQLRGKELNRPARYFL